jgi:hypothetical protein
MNIQDFASTRDQKRWLVEQLEHAAAWRELKAERYPDDSRNAQCAATLHHMATTVKALPATHELFRQLARIASLEDSIRERCLDEVNHLISRAGLSSPNSAQVVVQRLIEITDARSAH